ncbi:MAG: hypothetical protein AAF495_02695 [Pseudomonadota bacterium]
MPRRCSFFRAAASAQTRDSFRLTDGEWSNDEKLKDLKVGGALRLPYHADRQEVASASFSARGAKNDKMSDRFNQSLKQLKESGRYDQIFADAMAGKYVKPK